MVLMMTVYLLQIIYDLLFLTAIESARVRTAQGRGICKKKWCGKKLNEMDQLMDEKS